MKKRVLAGFMALMLCLTLLPTAAFAAEQDVPSPVYVSSSGNDDADGAGTKASPFATLAKAVNEAQDGATIYVMSNLEMKDCARFYDKHLTITSDGENQFTIIRGKNFAEQQDNARSTYNPAMIEVQGSSAESVGLTLKNIILDDANLSEGTIFAQASSEEGHGGNTVYVQDAIIASNATVPCTITLGEGAILRNFGGMSALRATDQAKIVMESGSVIEDDESTARSRGETGSVGPAGAAWIQGGTLVMEEGSAIQNINGRAVYADGGVVEIGGTISGITGSKEMWQNGKETPESQDRGINGTAIHLRNGAQGTLTATALIEDISGDGNAVYSDSCDLTAEYGSVIKNLKKTTGIAVIGKCKVNFNGEITKITQESLDDRIQALNLQNGEFHVTIGKDAYIHDNEVWYGAVYIQAENGKLDIYGKINNNTSSDHGGAVAEAQNFGPTIVNMYDGAEICNNYSSQTGGGIMVSRGTFTMYGGIISGNRAALNGGGVFVRRGGSFILEGGTISDNATAELGGGICFDASDNNGLIPKVELNGGTIESNLMSATITVDEDNTVTVSGGSSNDLAISNTAFGKIDRYLSISDEVTIGNEAVYFQTGSKTVTPADDSLAIKLGNASNDTKNKVNVVESLTAASTAKGWGNPLVTFWAQRVGAATLSVGGLTTLNSNLPVYVLALPVSDTGAASDIPAQVYAAQETTEADTTVNFTLPDISGDGYAIAIVQPTADYGTLTISGPATIQEDKNAENYSVAYTVTYDVSENMKNIIEQAGGTAGYSLTINQDNRLSGTPGTFDGSSIEVAYTLPSSAFAAGESLFASAVLTITVGQNTYTIPSNVAETKMVGLYDVWFNWNDGTGKVETVSVADGQPIGTKMPADPTRSGYTFTGWNTQPDGTGTAVTKDTVVTGRLTAYAQWSKNSSGGGGGSSTTYYYFAIEKIDAQDSHTLNGAKFGLYLDGKQIATATSNRNGIATFRVDTSDYRKIDAKSALYYQELTAPEGYVVSSDKIDIEKSDLTTSQTTAEKNAEMVRNYRSTTPADLNSLDHVAYVHGYTDGTVKPNNNITRAETAMMLYRLLTDTRRAEIQTVSNRFSDVSSSDWYNEAVSTMTNGNYIAGYRDGTFGGYRSITRAEFVTMLVRFIGTQDVDCSFTDISRGYWAYDYIATATQAGWIAGYSDGSFKPEQAITRAEAMTIINRTLNRGVDENSALLNFKAWPDNTVSDWFYYEVIEATNEHEYKGARPSEQWTSLTIH